MFILSYIADLMHLSFSSFYCRKIDEHLQRTACKFLDCEEIERLRRPVHLNVKLTKSTDRDSLLNVRRFSVYRSNSLAKTNTSIRNQVALLVVHP